VANASEKKADYAVATPVRHVRLFRNGANQAARIQQLSAQIGGALCTRSVVECESRFGAE
jgi:hypothetical protein